MAKLYKVHPAIGIMRVGNSDAYFIGPEALGHPGIEVQASGTEMTVQAYKANGLLKRQAARFRVWEYDINTNGATVPIREVLAPATIEWTVTLVNAKAAGNQIRAVPDRNRNVLLPVGAPRNATITDRASLVIQGGTKTVTGPSAALIDFDGQFLGQNVRLGHVTTDADGRLIVVGGFGKSAGIPTTTGGALPPLNNFANNDRWHDDVSDGPVTARITFPGGAPPIDAIPAWVLCAPPDFAPAARAPISLYEIALDAAITRGWIVEPTTPSFRRHIYPILQRALSMRWVHDYTHWNAVTDNWPALSDLTNHNARRIAFDQVTQPSLHEYGIPRTIESVLIKWRDGNFLADWNQPDPAISPPDALDRAALEACIATSFFPGIEAGFTIANPALYMEPLRLSHQQVAAGQLTAQMAVPWQADFNDCAEDWWPSQRPTDIFAKVADIPSQPVPWADGVYTGDSAASRRRMVLDFHKLGLVTADAAGNLVETERDPSLPPR